MIKKITSIKGIGSFKDLNFQYPVSENWNNRELKKTNIIYAENGMGKTTLTMIIHYMPVRGWSNTIPFTFCST